MTSRAEYRLLLRQDNADSRLTPIGYEAGLIDEARYQALLEKEKAIAEEIQRLETTTVGTSLQVQELLSRYGSTALKRGVYLSELIKRPELNYEILAEIDPDRPVLPASVAEQVNIQIKYEGYIKRQEQQVNQFHKLETRKLSPSFNYEQVKGLRKEAAQKLNLYKPISIGQASRISGVSPADISVLLVYMEREKQ